MGLSAVAEPCHGVESTGHLGTLLSDIPPALRNELQGLSVW